MIKCIPAKLVLLLWKETIIKIKVVKTKNIKRTRFLRKHMSKKPKTKKIKEESFWLKQIDFMFAVQQKPHRTTTVTTHKIRKRITQTCTREVTGASKIVNLVLSVSK